MDILPWNKSVVKNNIFLSGMQVICPYVKWLHAQLNWYNQHIWKVYISKTISRVKLFFNDRVLKSELRMYSSMMNRRPAAVRFLFNRFLGRKHNLLKNCVTRSSADNPLTEWWLKLDILLRFSFTRVGCTLFICNNFQDVELLFLSNAEVSLSDQICIILGICCTQRTGRSK